jgi:hypothetical protein
VDKTLRQAFIDQANAELEDLIGRYVETAGEEPVDSVERHDRRLRVVTAAAIVQLAQQLAPAQVQEPNTALLDALLSNAPEGCQDPPRVRTDAVAQRMAARRNLRDAAQQHGDDRLQLVETAGDEEPDPAAAVPDLPDLDEMPWA